MFWAMNEKIIQMKISIFSTWEGWMNTFFIWAAKEPWTFLYYVLLCLSPFFLISALLSYKLSKAIEKQEKKTARRRSPRSHWFYEQNCVFLLSLGYPCKLQCVPQSQNLRKWWQYLWSPGFHHKSFGKRCQGCHQLYWRGSNTLSLTRTSCFRS